MADLRINLKSLALAVAEILHWVYNFTRGHLTLTTPFQGRFFVGMVGLAMVNQCTKFVASIGSPVTKLWMAAQNAENGVIWGS